MSRGLGHEHPDIGVLHAEGTDTPLQTPAWYVEGVLLTADLFEKDKLAEAIRNTLALMKRAALEAMRAEALGDEAQFEALSAIGQRAYNHFMGLRAVVGLEAEVRALAPAKPPRSKKVVEPQGERLPHHACT